MFVAIMGLLIPLAATQSTSPPGGRVTPPPRRDVPGVRKTLKCGELFIPDFFDSDKEVTELVVWSLGAAWCAQQSFYDARKNAVLLTLNEATRKEGFADPAQFE